MDKNKQNQKNPQNKRKPLANGIPSISQQAEHQRLPGCAGISSVFCACACACLWPKSFTPTRGNPPSPDAICFVEQPHEYLQQNLCE